MDKDIEYIDGNEIYNGIDFLYDFQNILSIYSIIAVVYCVVLQYAPNAQYLDIIVLKLVYLSILFFIWFIYLKIDFIKKNIDAIMNSISDSSVKTIFLLIFIFISIFALELLVDFVLISFYNICCLLLKIQTVSIREYFISLLINNVFFYLLYFIVFILFLSFELYNSNESDSL